MAHNFSIKPGDMIKLRRNANDEIFAGGQPAHATSHLVIFSYLRVGTTEEGIYFTDTFLDQDVPAGVGPYKGLDEDLIHHALDCSDRYSRIINVESYLGETVRYGMVKDLQKYMIGATGSVAKKTLAYPNGLNCSGCGERFPMAEPNQPDGSTLICYCCRQNPWR